MQQSSNYDIMANIKSRCWLLLTFAMMLDVASLMANVATASKTVTLSSLESLDDFQKVSVKRKDVKLKDQMEVVEE